MRHSLRFMLLAGLLAASLLAGCAAKPARTQAPAEPAVFDGGRVPALAATPAAAPKAMPAPASAGYDASLDAEEVARKIILTANLQLVVRETENTVSVIKQLVAARGGFVSSANVWREGVVLRAHLTVRVPAETMEPFLAEVKKLAVQVEREETGGQDVTEEYVDIEAQLRNLEAAEKELRELLTTVREKTGKAEDVMAVYRELTNVRGHIDRLTGRRQYLDRMTELATVNLDLSERQPEPIGRPGWQPVQTLRQALNALVQTGKLGVDILIWVAAFLLPLLIVPALGLWLLWRWARRRAAHKAKAKELSKPESLT